jgi:hypothetical protein
MRRASIFDVETTARLKLRRNDSSSAPSRAAEFLNPSVLDRIIEGWGYDHHLLQALWREGLQKERDRPWPSALPLPQLRLRLHHDAAARQTARHEGLGAVALRHGQHEFLLHRPSARRQ